jgi:hypothetical protein
MQKMTMNFQQFNATMYQMAQQQIQGSPPNKNTPIPYPY